MSNAGRDTHDGDEIWMGCLRSDECCSGSQYFVQGKRSGDNENIELRRVCNRILIKSYQFQGL